MKCLTGLMLLLLAHVCQASEENVYRQLIQQSLNQQPLCLGETQWPVAIQSGSDVWVNAKMEALVDAGLISSHVKGGQKIWDLTPYGRTAFRKKQDFCYGTLRVSAIQAIQSVNTNLTRVTFTYTIHELPVWAKNHSVRVANSDLDNLVGGIDTVRYQAIFAENNRHKPQLVGEPEQLDLLY